MNDRASKDGFMTKAAFVRLYGSCGKILHARNPFSSTDPVTQIGHSIDEWANRIENLLRWHLMNLLDSGKWVVNVPASGPVHVFPAEPTARRSGA